MKCILLPLKKLNGQNEMHPFAAEKIKQSK